MSPPDERSGPPPQGAAPGISDHHVADRGQPTAAVLRIGDVAMPTRPPLSGITRDLLGEAQHRDDELYRTAGCCLVDMRDAWRAMDATERTLLMVDAFRWRYYWLSGQVEYRLEVELAAQRRLMAEVSHDVASGFSAGVGPSHREMMRRRYPPTGNVDEWVRSGPPGHRDFLGQPGREAAA